MLKDTTLTAGIDTGKDTLDVAVHGTESRFKVDNTKAGWQRLAAELAKAGVGRIGIEATGGYERDVTRQLQDQGFTVLVLQPLQVRAFARLHLCRAKTDRLDAILIAACTHVLKPQARTPDPRLDALVDRLTFIEQVEADIVRLKTRLEHIHDPRLREIVSGDIKTLRARRTDELRRLLKAVREHADLAAAFPLEPGAQGAL